MSALAGVRCVVPRFAQYVARPFAFTTTFVPRKSHITPAVRTLSTTIPKRKKETVTIHFVDRDGDTVTTDALVGSSFLDIAIDNGVELEDKFCKVKDQGLPQILGFRYLEAPLPVDGLCKGNVSIHFVCDDGIKHTTNAKVGDNLLDVVIEKDIDLDGFGACEGTLACSTCHLIFEQSDYDKLPQEPSDEELDMLDLAYGLQDTSRLGCQIIVSKDMDGLVVRVPAGVADAREP